MKLSMQRTFVFVSLAALACAFGLAGCVTTKKVDWNTRVGNYTYDQAVTEMGPPDKEARTSDGKTVAEWMAPHSGGSSISIGTGFYGGHGGVAIGQTVGSGYQKAVTRLTFGTDGKLTTWSKN